MLTTIDQTGQQVVINTGIPLRIISLVPSQTELLHYLGLEEEVVGITKFCIHPQAWFKSKQRVGGTKAVHIEVIKALNPTLIIANKEENVKEQVGTLQQVAPVWVSDVNNLDDALAMIKQVGEVVQKEEEAKALVEQVRNTFLNLAENFNAGTNQLLNQSNPLPVTYLIWNDPYMTVGGDTFINDMLKRAGFFNVFESKTRYPQITLEDIPETCRYILLSSEPFPFKEKHAEEIRQALPGKKIVFVDGEIFSWYGSRLLLAAQYFKELHQHILGSTDNCNTLA